MIRTHHERVRTSVTRRTSKKGETAVVLTLDHIAYRLTADEARRLADQLHDHAEELP